MSQILKDSGARARLIDGKAGAAIVDAAEATQVLSDGMWVEVDGTEGVLRIVAE